MGASEEITLARLHSLHLEEDFGVRHFSGTMTYLYSLSINNIYLQDDICLRLDLGRVEVLAEVLVNGKRASMCWAPPYAIDIQEIMYRTAFTNRSHFYKEFGKRYNQTPKEYRESNKYKDDSLN